MCVLRMEHDKLFAIADELLLSPVTLLVRLIMHGDTHDESYRRAPPCVLVIPSLLLYSSSNANKHPLCRFDEESGKQPQ